VCDGVAVPLQRRHGKLGQLSGLGLLQAHHVGRARSRKRPTASSLARSELRFQVATRRYPGAGPAGDIDARRSRAALRRSSRAASIAAREEFAITVPAYPIASRNQPATGGPPVELNAYRRPASDRLRRAISNGWDWGSSLGRAGRGSDRGSNASTPQGGSDVGRLDTTGTSGF
jgi:hypothetical protein